MLARTSSTLRILTPLGFTLGKALVQGAPQLFENGSGHLEKDQEALTAQLYQSA
jgi:hypothetical protein